jgi:hypothetical protein
VGIPPLGGLELLGEGAGEGAPDHLEIEVEIDALDRRKAKKAKRLSRPEADPEELFHGAAGDDRSRHGADDVCAKGAARRSGRGERPPHQDIDAAIREDAMRCPARTAGPVALHRRSQRRRGRMLTISGQVERRRGGGHHGTSGEPPHFVVFFGKTEMG